MNKIAGCVVMLGMMALLAVGSPGQARSATIVGPEQIIAGSPATYTESQSSDNGYQWTVQPNATLEADGASVVFKPTVGGTYKLACSGATRQHRGLFGWRHRLVPWDDSLTITVLDKPLGKWQVSYAQSVQTVKAIDEQSAISSSVPPAPQVKAIDAQARPSQPRGPPRQFARGLKPTPPGMLKAAIRAGEPLMAKLRALPQPPENYDGSGGVRDFGMYGNDRYGTCVTAEEAAAKAVISAKTGAKEISIPDQNVIDYCRKYGGLNGDYLDVVLDRMTKYGLIDDGGKEHKDDPTAVALDGTKRLIVQLAIYYTGQIKVGVAADQVQSACDGSYGWVLIDGYKDKAEDHCVGYCGYGTLEFCCQTLGVPVPKGADPKRFCLIMFTWATLGIVDWETAQGITSEWWMRGTDPDRLDAEAWRVTYQKVMADITGGNVTPPNAVDWLVTYPAQDAATVEAGDAADAVRKVPYKGKPTAKKAAENLKRATVRNLAVAL